MLIEKIKSGDEIHLDAGEKKNIKLDREFLYSSILINANLDDSLTGEQVKSALRQIECNIYAGTIDKAFMTCNLIDLEVISYLQNKRYLQFPNNDLSALITFDYKDDTVETPIFPRLLDDVKVEIKNPTSNALDVRLGYRGINTEDYYDFIRIHTKQNLSNEQIDALLRTRFKKRIFASREETLTASQQDFDISNDGWFDKIVIYSVSGDINEIELKGMSHIVEKNSIEVLSDMTFLENELDPDESPASQLAVISNVPPGQYKLRVYGNSGTIFRILTEVVR